MAVENDTRPGRCPAAVEAERLSHAVSEAAQSLATLVDLLKQDARHVDNNGWNYSGGLAALLQGISDNLFSEWGKTPCKVFDCQHEHAGSVREEPRP